MPQIHTAARHPTPWPEAAYDADPEGVPWGELSVRILRYRIDRIERPAAAT